jgi:hypothetical protein
MSLLCGIPRTIETRATPLPSVLESAARKDRLPGSKTNRRQQHFSQPVACPNKSILSRAQGSRPVFWRIHQNVGLGGSQALRRQAESAADGPRAGVASGEHINVAVAD